MIGFAGRDAARGQNQIVIGGGGGDGACELLRIVAQNAEIGDRGAEAREQPGEQIAVGIVKRGARQRRSRLDDLVAGREQRRPARAGARKLGETERRRERHMLHRKPPAGGQRHRAVAHIFAGEPPIGAALKSGRHHDAVAVDAAILLHEHRIGAVRHRRAGENADRLARL